MMTKQDAMNLFSSSAAIIIDDEVLDKETRAGRITKEFEDKGVCFVKYKEVPDAQQWVSFDKFSFLIVDWKIEDENRKRIAAATGGVGITQYSEEIEKELIDFLCYMVGEFLMPVFVFSQENVTPIKDKIKTVDILNKALERNQLFVRTKQHASNADIEELMYKWCKENPAVYTLKSIDSSINKARNSLFKSLYESKPEWPLIVYQTIQKDIPSDGNEEFGEFLINSLLGRIDFLEFDQDILTKSHGSLEENEIISIYSNSKLYTYERSQPKGPHTGDLYVLEGVGNDKEEFYLNITAGCDLRNKNMIFLKGNICKNYNYHEAYGLINKSVSTYIPLLHGHRCVEFFYKNYIATEMKDHYKALGCGGKTYKRIGRLIHPYITVIQEGFSRYICRQGLSRHPDSILRQGAITKKAENQTDEN